MYKFKILVPPSSSRLFLILWNLCFFIHETRSWKSSALISVALISLAVSLVYKNERFIWPLSLAPVIAILGYHYPHLANHLLLILLVNLYLLTIWFFNEHLEIGRISRTLASLLAVVYMWAAIHKMNWDFINPEVSCANEALGEYLGWLFDSENRPAYRSWVFVPLVVLVFQSLFEPLLLSRKTFLVGVTLALGFHAFLAPIGFVHFAAIPLIIFYFNWLSRMPLSEKEKALWMKAAYIYIGLHIFVGLLGAINIYAQVSRITMLTQFAIWLVASSLMISRMWIFAIRNKQFSLAISPKLGWHIVLPLVAVLLGSSNYLGLGTSNSFSMFSNLRTEGNFWNHLFIPKAVRVFKYQDNIYFVDTIVKSYARSVDDRPNPDFGLPALEIYRLYDIWRTMVTLPKIFLVKHSADEKPFPVYDELSPDIRPYSFWEYKLLNFRSVQMTGPNRCRW